jgi:hypothetical protein
MFKNILNTDFFQDVTNEATETYIKNDRHSYKKIFDLIRSEITQEMPKNNTKNNTKNNLSRDNIIFSNVDKITNRDIKISLDDVESDMTIYTIHARKVATIITNIIHRYFGKFVQMRSILPNEEYDIMFNMRNLIKIYRIERYKNVRLDELFNTVDIDGLLYFPINVELIDIYHKLYLPNYNEFWDSIYKNENVLYNLIKNTKHGGDSKCVKCTANRNIDIQQIKLLLLKFLNGENYVIVGGWAHNMLENNKTESDCESNIQIISENNIENDYDNILMYLNKFTQYGIYYKKKLLYIPKDNRIFKYTFFIKYPTFGKDVVDKQFLDIYNCGSYELIPYIDIKYKGFNLKIGNIYVQMRFLLIDLWIINLLKSINEISADLFNTKYDYIFNTMGLLKKIMPDGFKNSPNNYIGINFDEKIAQKLEISEKQIKRTSYYPELSIKLNKKYKCVATS